MSFKIKEIRPLFTGVVVTAKRYVGDQFTQKGGGLIYDPRMMDGSMNPYQTVVCAGSTVRDVKKGDIVKINFSRYAIAKHTPGQIDAALNIQTDNLSITYQIPKITIDDIDYLFIQDRDIEYVVTDYEVDEGGLLQ